MDYSIVIPVFNCVEYTEKCIDSIYNVRKIDVTDYDFEIVVVDNHSTDSTPELLKQYKNKYENFKYVANKENLGFAKACNIGARHSKGEYIIFLNNDTEVTPEWSRYLIDTIRVHDDVWIAGSKCLYPDRTIQHAGVVFSDNKLPFHIYRNFPEYHPAVNIERSYLAVTGACLAIKRKNFLSLKGFDESYLNGYEDIDLCLKVKSLNKRVIYQPKSVIIHHESKTPGRLKEKSLKKNYSILSERWLKDIKPDAFYHYRENNLIRILRTEGKDIVEFNRCDKSFIINLEPESKVKEEQEAVYKRVVNLEKQLTSIYHSDSWKVMNTLVKIARKTGLVYILKAMLILKRKGIKELLSKIKERLFKNKKYKSSNDALSKNRHINVDSVEKLPISVILTTTKKKKAILNDFVIPLLKRNKPAEIILIDNDNLSLQEKRAKGVKLAKEKFVFFCNDNILLGKNHLFRLFNRLMTMQTAGYVYTDYKSVNISVVRIKKYNHYFKSQNFNIDVLRKSNYISPITLVKKDALIGEIDKTNNIKDLWIRLFEKGVKGTYLKDVFFIEVHSDEKIFNNEEIEQNISLDVKKPDSDKENKLPVSVIVTAIKSRLNFTKEFVIPAIELNNPSEIILIDDKNLNVQQKRNKGVSLAKEKYLFFSDDDILLPHNHLKTLSDYLDANPDVGYVYTDYQAVVLDMENHPIKKNYYHQSKEFDGEILKQENYISTMSMVRKDVFCGFDEKIKRLQDWDLWLTLLERGVKGKYVPDTGFLAFYLDAGITSNKTPLQEAIRIIREKHHTTKNSR